MPSASRANGVKLNQFPIPQTYQTDLPVAPAEFIRSGTFTIYIAFVQLGEQLLKNDISQTWRKCGLRGWQEFYRESCSGDL